MGLSAHKLFSPRLTFRRAYWYHSGFIEYLKHTTGRLRLIISKKDEIDSRFLPTANRATTTTMNQTTTFITNLIIKTSSKDTAAIQQIKVYEMRVIMLCNNLLCELSNAESIQSNILILHSLPFPQLITICHSINFPTTSSLMMVSSLNVSRLPKN